MTTHLHCSSALLRVCSDSCKGTCLIALERVTLMGMISLKVTFLSARELLQHSPNCTSQSWIKRIRLWHWSGSGRHTFPSVSCDHQEIDHKRLFHRQVWIMIYIPMWSHWVSCSILVVINVHMNNCNFSFISLATSQPWFFAPFSLLFISMGFVVVHDVSHTKHTCAMNPKFWSSSIIYGDMMSPLATNKAVFFSLIILPKLEKSTWTVLIWIYKFHVLDFYMLLCVTYIQLSLLSHPPVQLSLKECKKICIKR